MSHNVWLLFAAWAFWSPSGLLFCIFLAYCFVSGLLFCIFFFFFTTGFSDWISSVVSPCWCNALTDRIFPFCVPGRLFTLGAQTDEQFLLESRVCTWCISREAQFFFNLCRQFPSRSALVGATLVSWVSYRLSLWKSSKIFLFLKGCLQSELKAQKQAEVEFAIGFVWPLSANRNVLRTGDRALRPIAHIE